MKAPEPAPSCVLELATVGDPVVFQQTPLAVMVAPPSAEMFPPEIAVVVVMEDAEAVESVGRVITGVAWVVKVISGP